TMPMGITPQRGGIEAPKKRRPWASVAAVAILFVVLSGVGYVVTRPRAQAKASATAPKAITVAPATQTPESAVARAAAAGKLARPSGIGQSSPAASHAAATVHDGRSGLGASPARAHERRL